MLTWPSRQGWQECLFIAVTATGLIGTIAYATSLIVWQVEAKGIWQSLLFVMLVPAFTEELFFRGVLIPDAGEGPRAQQWFGFGIGLFILWHVIEATTFLKGATLFLKPEFLICAAILGTACACMRYRTGSLWPAVLFHGVLVWAWKSFFGGPSLAELM
ncbi:CPBP family glutamic-type intramembrane protease [Asticcacaulis sp. SL142]|uniref:CPBP family glutamic-type intramembrane protease n=1 Tax=Asticcacaulis sp. SL142 TaxID=2995155 RepID=UPI00226CE217|nr:CPBP family glutamic-type intramembrane protease [Asticcacaulis sp. SL142]WAC49511.1 CPBP family glutamic-type intramembrane protease [Asticcacaulis sp. SL142]